MTDRNHRHLVIVAPAAVRSAPASAAGERGEASAPADEGELLLVGDVAKAVGKTVRAIHLYEELGLVRAHERSKGRYRLFAQDALVRVRWIVKLQNLGLSLSDIQTLVRGQADAASAQFAAMRLREVYLAKLVETRSKLTELKALESELEQSLEFLSTCHSACESEVPVHSCPTCERHPEQPNPPELVIGSRVN
ncbi:MAG TPA: MerR family transcriptional regulator [Polyangiaceae bacterium]|jgi:MerR family copper efflux transcriptional regulator|nr:MerR family transcriptional regulator [Polyangiaceae bacterium]